MIASSRDDTREAAAVAVALLASLAVGSALMLAAGKSPGHVWWLMVERTLFTDSYSLGQVLYKATALVLTGLAVSVALDAGLFNIGAEGQVTAGVVACAVVGAALPAGTPALVAIPLCILAAAAAGAAIGGAIGALRVWRGAHEVITSIMLNAIVAGIALWLGNELLFRNGTTTGPPIVAARRVAAARFRGQRREPVDRPGRRGGRRAVVVACAHHLGPGVARGRSRSRGGARGRDLGRPRPAGRDARGRRARRARRHQLRARPQARVRGGARPRRRATRDLGRAARPDATRSASRRRRSCSAFLSAGGLAVSQEVPKELTEMLQGVVVLAVASAGPIARRYGRAPEDLPSGVAASAGREVTP